MKTWITIGAATILLGGISACGAGSDAPDGIAPETSDGGDDQSLCSRACTKVTACAQRLFQAEYAVEPCEEQCGRELAGTGYLDPEVARIAFGYKSRLPDDSSCERDFDAVDEIVENDYRELSRKSVIDECEVAYRDSGCATGAPAAVRLGCFATYVKLAPRYRASTEACGYPTGACGDFQECLDSNTFPAETGGGNPWYGRDFGGAM